MELRRLATLLTPAAGRRVPPTCPRPGTALPPLNSVRDPPATRVLRRTGGRWDPPCGKGSRATRPKGFHQRPTFDRAGEARRDAGADDEGAGADQGTDLTRDREAEPASGLRRVHRLPESPLPGALDRGASRPQPPGVGRQLPISTAPPLTRPGRGRRRRVVGPVPVEAEGLEAGADGAEVPGVEAAALGPDGDQSAPVGREAGGVHAACRRGRSAGELLPGVGVDQADLAVFPLEGHERGAVCEGEGPPLSLGGNLRARPPTSQTRQRRPPPPVVRSHRPSGEKPTRQGPASGREATSRPLATSQTRTPLGNWDAWFPPASQRPSGLIAARRMSSPAPMVTVPPGRRSRMPRPRRGKAATRPPSSTDSASAWSPRGSRTSGGPTRKAPPPPSGGLATGSGRRGRWSGTPPSPRSPRPSSIPGRAPCATSSPRASSTIEIRSTDSRNRSRPSGRYRAPPYWLRRSGRLVSPRDRNPTGATNLWNRALRPPGRSAPRAGHPGRMTGRTRLPGRAGGPWRHPRSAGSTTIRW